MSNCNDDALDSFIEDDSSGGCNLCDDDDDDNGSDDGFSDVDGKVLLSHL